VTRADDDDAGVSRDRGVAPMNTAGLPPELHRVHMVGIGGAGMSGIARILLDRGGQVSGSDAKESRGVHALRARGAAIRIGHDASSLDLLPGGATTVITTHAAIPNTNPELLEARRRGIPVLLRPAVLAKLMAGRTTLMVTGTHGKTTTTSMLVVVLQHCGLDPSFAVGGELGEAGTNAHHGSGEYFVAEADESDGSLLEYTPNVAVVTNIESDHLDFFGSADAYTAAFDSFVGRLAPGGALVVCVDDPGAAALADRSAAQGIRVLRYGSGWRGTANGGREAGSQPLTGELLSFQQQGTGAVAHIKLAGQPHPEVLRLSVPGRHMALNALAALLAAIEVGAPADPVLDGLAGFEGVRRRFELVGAAGSVRVFDDYAHHPTEISATLATVRALLAQSESDSGPGRSLVVFQPHMYSRTTAFASEFGRALDAADEVFVLDVYGAREQPLPGVSGASVVQHVSAPVHYVPDFSAVADAVAAAAGPGDVIVTMGAGDVTMLGPEIVTALRLRVNRSSPGRPRVL
jgi:UDP-N-acetylmuramate--alanine ligase